MADIIIMPKQGLQMTEGTITQWLAKEGDAVTEGKPLFEMETDKLTITMDSTATGTLLKILHGEGDVVPITEAIAIVGNPGEDISALVGSKVPAVPAAPAEASAPAAAAPAAPAAAPAARPAGSRVFSSPRARMRAGEKGYDVADIPGSGPEGMVIERDVLSYVPAAAPAAALASPLAKKVAALNGVSLDGITGTGSHGKIMAGDIPVAKAAAAAAPARGEKKVPLSGMRKVVAKRMHDSLSIMAQANHRITVDMTEAVRLREQLKKLDIKVSYNDIVLRCVARALVDCPYMNVSFEDDGIVWKEYVNLGMAVAVDNGLIVPVIKDADLMGLQEISKAGADLAKRAKDNKLQPDEYTGGTFTVSNLGMFGLDSFTAIINPPEAGILAVGRMEKKPVVLPDDTIGIRPLMTLSLTYDHRAVDGAPAAKFLQRIKQLLETPSLML